MTLTEVALAKLNLALHVRRRRPDGYHALETLFAFTDFGDTLTAEPADALTLTVTGETALALAAEPDNLVLRAARALAPGLGARLVLTKRIPVAAGLGGGSADAAAALRLLSRLWEVEADLFAIAERLGSDVPACLLGRAARGEGRGEQLTPVPDWRLTGTPVLLVNPRVAVPTGPVFAAWDGDDRGPLGDDALAGRNDLETPAIGIAPVIADVLARLRAGGPMLARMSGSGATCFALYADAAARDAAAAAMPGAWWVQPTALR